MDITVLYLESEGNDLIHFLNLKFLFFMKTIKTLLALLAITGFVACQKDALVTYKTDATEELKSNKALLVDNNWVKISETSMINGEKEDIFASSEECAKDNTMEFKGTGSLILGEGATMCDPNARETTEGNWNFEGVEQKMVTVAMEDYTYKAEITELNNLVLVWKFTSPSNPDETIEQVFVKRQ
jgi:hypothetical protein